MMTRTDRAELAAALATSIDAMLGALSRAEDSSNDEWNVVIGRVKDLYRDLGKQIDGIEQSVF